MTTSNNSSKVSTRNLVCARRCWLTFEQGCCQWKTNDRWKSMQCSEALHYYWNQWIKSKACNFIHLRVAFQCKAPFVHGRTLRSFSIKIILASFQKNGKYTKEEINRTIFTKWATLEVFMNHQSRQASSLWMQVQQHLKTHHHHF